MWPNLQFPADLVTLTAEKPLIENFIYCAVLGRAHYEKITGKRVHQFVVPALFLEILTHLFRIHPFCTSWKHQKTVRFSDVFREYRKGALGKNGLIAWGE